MSTNDLFIFYLSLFFQFFFFCTGLLFPLCPRCYNIRLSVCRFYNPLVFHNKALNGLYCRSCSASVFFSHTTLLTENCSWDSASLNWPKPTMDLRSSLNWDSTCSLTDSIRSIKGCDFQSMVCLSTWLRDSQLLFIHCVSVLAMPSGSWRFFIPVFLNPCLKVIKKGPRN